MRADHFRRLDHFLIRCVLIAIADIVHNGSGKDKTILHHNSHLASKTFQGHAADVDAIDQHFSAVHIVKTTDKIHNRRLSGSCRSDDRDTFSRLRLQIYMLKNLDSRFVTKSNILKLDFSTDRRHRDRVFTVFDIDRLINCLKNSLQIRNRREERIVKRCQRIDRVPEAADICGKCYQHTDRNTGIRLKHPLDSKYVDKRCRDIGNNIHHR